MRKLCVLISGLVLMSCGSFSAQVPLSQVEGFLEVYLPQDTTSVYIGLKAGQHIDTSFKKYNVFLGSEAGKHNTSGSDNVLIGRQAGYMNGTGAQNVFIGEGAGYNNISGDNNVFIGEQAGDDNVSGDGNVFIGVEAGEDSKGDYNTFIGFQAGEDVDSTSHNTGIGYDAGDYLSGDYNTFIGSMAGGDSDNGESNVGLGFQAGYDNNGSFNCFLGPSAGYDNEADKNVFVGYESGRNNGDGNSNSFLGYHSGLNNDDGEFNSFFGNEAGLGTVSGSRNVFVGSTAGKANVDGRNQTFIGAGAGLSSRHGQNSVVMGNGAAFNDTSILSSVYIGHLSGQLSPGLETSRTGNVFIGNFAGFNQTESNRLFISNSSVDSTEALIYGEFDNGGLLRVNGDLQIAAPTTGVNSRLLMKGVNGDLNEVIRYDVSNNDVVMGSVTGGGGKLFLRANANTRMAIIENGDVGIGTTAPTQKLHVEGSARFTENIFADNLSAVAGTHDLRWNAITGLITSSTSDVRLKDNVKTITHALDKVLHLRGVSFNWKELPNGQPQLGLIAQEVKEVLPEVVSINKNGYYGVDYSETIGVFVEAIKEQQSMIEGQQDEINGLKLLLNKALFQIEKINNSLSEDNATSLD